MVEALGCMYVVSAHVYTYIGIYIYISTSGSWYALRGARILLGTHKCPRHNEKSCAKKDLHPVSMGGSAHRA